MRDGFIGIVYEREEDSLEEDVSKEEREVEEGLEVITDMYRVEQGLFVREEKESVGESSVREEECIWNVAHFCFSR